MNPSREWITDQGVPLDPNRNEEASLGRRVGRGLVGPHQVANFIAGGNGGPLEELLQHK